MEAAQESKALSLFGIHAPGRPLTKEEVDRIWGTVDEIIANKRTDPRYGTLCGLFGIEFKGGVA